jgi:hypothetical protein
MVFVVTFQDSNESNFSGDDTFEFLDGGVLKITATTPPLPTQTYYYAPGVWQSVVGGNSDDDAFWRKLRHTIGGFLQREWQGFKLG